MNEKFVFLKSWLDIVNVYPTDKQLLILKSIIEIGLNPDSNLSTYPDEVKPILILIKDSITRMQDNYKKKSEAGKKGMKNRWCKNNDYDYFIENWNKIGLYKIEKMTDSQIEKIDNFLSKNDKGIINSEVISQKIKESDFLQGKTEHSFKFTFEFMLENIDKINGDFYKNRDSKCNIGEIWN